MGWGKTLMKGLAQPLFVLGGASFSALSLLKGALLILLVHFAAKGLGRAAEQWFRSRLVIPDYTAAILSRWVKIGVWVLGLLLIADFLGIKLSSLTFFAGALGVGIGFGLQTIVNNFISGLILLIERTMKVGDVVSVSGEIGRIVHIGARATLIETPRGAVIAIPNIQFITTPVTNWTLSGHNIRLHIPLTVAPVDNPEELEELLLTIARSHPQVLPEPPPQVWLTKIGDTFSYELLIWVTDPMDGARQVQHDLYHALLPALRERGIAVRG